MWLGWEVTAKKQTNLFQIFEFEKSGPLTKDTERIHIIKIYIFRRKKKSKSKSPMYSYSRLEKNYPGQNNIEIYLLGWFVSQARHLIQKNPMVQGPVFSFAGQKPSL